MLSKRVIKDFLKEFLEKYEVKVPKDIKYSELAETFCDFVLYDLYDWLADNFRAFFFQDDDGPDWEWIRDRIRDLRKKKG